MSYIGNEPIVSATRTITEITATAGQTVFVANGGYTVGYIDVFLNGAQLQTVDFTATNGSSITLTEAAQVGDVLKLVAWGTFSTSNLVSPNYTGTLTGGTGVVNIGSGQVYKDASGNVGIGTSSPTYKITSVYSGSSTAVTDYAFVGGSETYQMIGLSEDTANNAIAITNKYSSGGNILFRTGTGGTISERMKIDSAGRVTMSAQPAFATTGTNYTQASSGFSIVIPATEVFDIGNNFNISTGRFTAPVAGRYFFNVSGLVYPVTAGQFTGSFYVNGSQYEDIQDGYNPGQHNVYSISNVFNLAANDVVDFRLATGNSGTAAYSAQWMMSGYLVG